MAAQETRDFLYQLFRHVDPKRLAVLIAHDLEGCTLEEIAHIQGIAVSTASDRLRGAREELRSAHHRWEQEQRRLGMFVLPISLDALLAADRSTPRAPDAIYDMVWSRIERTLDVDAPKTAEPHDDDRGRTTTILPGGLDAAKAKAPWRAALGNVGSGLLGGALGVAATLALLRASPVAPVIAAPAAMSMPASSVAAAAIEAPAPATATAPGVEPMPSVRAPAVVVRSPASGSAAPPASASTTLSAGHDATLAAEVAQVDQVRAAFHRGDDAATLAALDRYDRDHPQGRFKADCAAIRAQLGHHEETDGGP